MTEVGIKKNIFLLKKEFYLKVKIFFPYKKATLSNDTTTITSICGQQKSKSKNCTALRDGG